MKKKLKIFIHRLLVKYIILYLKKKFIIIENPVFGYSAWNWSHELERDLGIYNGN